MLAISKEVAPLKNVKPAVVVNVKPVTAAKRNYNSASATGAIQRNLRPSPAVLRAPVYSHIKSTPSNEFSKNHKVNVLKFNTIG